MLAIIDFIKSHPDNWEDLLRRSPYFLNIKKKDNRILFKYSQIESKPSEEIVMDARGLILEKDTWKVVRMAFRRFYNYGEVCASEIDWESARAEEKIDGSLISVYFYDGEWKVATSGTIDAEDAENMAPAPYDTFRGIFDIAAQNCNLDFSKLDKDYTYTFELISPFLAHVVPATETTLYHLTTRNNATLEEVDVDLGIKKPRRFDLSCLDDAIAMTKSFTTLEEGFVVRDKYNRRIKVKSAAYVIAHRLNNNNCCTKLRLVELILANEQSEFLSYLPQWTEAVTDMEKEVDKFVREVEDSVVNAFKNKELDRKSFAAIATKTRVPFVWFNIYDGKIKEDVDVRELISSWGALKVTRFMFPKEKIKED